MLGVYSCLQFPSLSLWSLQGLAAFLTLAICVSLLFFCVSRGLSTLLIFSKNQLFLSFTFSSFPANTCIDFCLHFKYFLPSAQLGWALLFFFPAPEAVFQTIHFRLFFFPSVLIYCDKFPLSPAVALSHWFWMFYFHFIQFSAFWFPLRFLPDPWIPCSVLFHVQESRELPISFLLLISSLTPIWLKNTLWMVLILF